MREASLIKYWGFYYYFLLREAPTRSHIKLFHILVIGVRNSKRNEKQSNSFTPNKITMSLT